MTRYRISGEMSTGIVDITQEELDTYLVGVREHLQAVQVTASGDPAHYVIDAVVETDTEAEANALWWEVVDPALNAVLEETASDAEWVPIYLDELDIEEEEVADG